MSVGQCDSTCLVSIDAGGNGTAVAVNLVLPKARIAIHALAGIHLFINKTASYRQPSNN
jgi:hypothetical protein